VDDADDEDDEDDEDEAGEMGERIWLFYDHQMSTLLLSCHSRLSQLATIILRLYDPSILDPLCSS
jgi:hypothetical protein